MTLRSEPSRRIPLLDLKLQFESIREEVVLAIGRVLESQQFILGDEVATCEEEIASYSGSRYAVGCASGSDALMLALMALGIGAGDEVLTVSYTFFATAGAIARLGAKPVFVDIQEDTFNIDADEITDVLDCHPRIKAIIVVHLFGSCADMGSIRELATARQIPVIEDAAQAIGAEYMGQRAGSLGDVGCFSFFPSKNLGCFGDGGMCTTNDETLANRLRSLRMHGSRQKYVHEEVGVASRLDALQAAVLRVKLQRLDLWTESRQRNAALYRELFEARGLPVLAPAPKSYQTRHIYNQFVVRVERRDQLQNWLNQNGVGTEVYYPIPLHLQQCFADLGYSVGDLPVSEKLAQQSLALPIYPELAAEDIKHVVDLIAAFYKAV
jgi:dTDP-4-amino-4,6-dideoxygalactose transaminase